MNNIKYDVCKMMMYQYLELQIDFMQAEIDYMLDRDIKDHEEAKMLAKEVHDLDSLYGEWFTKVEMEYFEPKIEEQSHFKKLQEKVRELTIQHLEMQEECREEWEVLSKVRMSHYA